MDAEHESQLHALTMRLQMFASTETERFLRLDLEPALNFAELRPQFEFLRSLCERMLLVDWAHLPTAIVTEAATALERIEGPAAAIATFSVVKATEAGRPVTDARNSVASGFRDKFPVLLKQLTTALSVAQFSAEQKWAAERRLSMAALEEQLSSSVLAAKEATERVQRLEEVAMAAAQKAGITRHAVFFHDEADKHDRTATHWLWATGGIAATAVVLAAANLWLAFVKPAPASATDATYLLVAKLLVFTTVVSAALWCARVFRAHKHNAVVNRHRQHALSSFESFAESTADNSVKNMVLMQATQSIFAPQHSGFGTTDADPAIASPIVELVRSATSNQK